MKYPQRSKASLFLLTCLAGGLLLSAVLILSSPSIREALFGREILKGEISDALLSGINQQEWPSKVEFQGGLEAEIRYTLDDDLQAHAERLFRRYKPDYGALVAMDPNTGKILSLFGYSYDQGDIKNNYALSSGYPAASVFKVVTATAALDQSIADTDTVIPFNGRGTTLYKKNVYNETTNRWTRMPSLKKAFARSYNTVFGKIGLNYLGAETLKNYASRLGFNSSFDSDFPFESGESHFANNDDWSLVEAASGFTQDNTLSPVHGALIAAAAANNGVMMEPFIVDRLFDPESGENIYRSLPQISRVSMTATSAIKLKELMIATVKNGTSRKSFRNFYRKKRNRDILVGGKTGSLNGEKIRARHDWFIGFASRGEQKVAFSVLTVHKVNWKIKSATVAEQFIDHFFNRKEFNRQASVQDR